jgi:hypothetical protein
MKEAESLLSLTQKNSALIPIQTPHTEQAIANMDASVGLGQIVPVGRLTHSVHVRKIRKPERRRRMSDKTYGLKFKCDKCGVGGYFEFSQWKVRITGALEIQCPRCNKISVFIGKFGQDIYLERALDDVKDALKNTEDGKIVETAIEKIQREVTSGEEEEKEDG